MKVGDLVNFYTSAWVFSSANNRYANPGIVLKCSDSTQKQVAAEIYWRDGKITREHESYLQLMEEKY
jgi:hypothetical protein